MLVQQSQTMQKKLIAIIYSQSGNVQILCHLGKAKMKKG